MTHRIKQYCTPRQDLLSGTFNPEIFTPSLADVLDLYRGKTKIDSIYTDANAFFGEATFPSAGLALLTSQVFRRFKGEMNNPATYRLETAFGGGKTHALIALAHLSQKGSALREQVSSWVPAELLPAPGEVKLVGIVGEALKVTEYRGSAAEPWTLWREIAYQIDPKLAEEPWARSSSAPEREGPWFQNVLADRKVLLLIDELALYMTRLSAVDSDAPAQAAVFLKTIFDQRHSSSNLVTVLTLAGLRDAFSNQTEAIREALADASGKKLEEVSSEAAERAMEKSTDDIESVVRRDEASISIVAPEELAQIFSKRLFEKIDPAGAEGAAAAFMEAYSRWESDLSSEVNSEKMRERMVHNYPFHPTLIDFLYNKLSSVEHFQGTRGVLQTMSVVIHRIWSEKDQNPIMIQVGDIDLRGARVNDMILGRTRSLDLEPALSTDIGGKGKGEEHAARLDREEANPAEPHWHEKVWRVVFLNSLA
ncbi:MAG TPA: DUF499 domain-containing protein, partial [Opitutales bacterium]|nr:DUF499 domain-containing protein [Opitutales bacterium]